MEVSFDPSMSAKVGRFDEEAVSVMIPEKRWKNRRRDMKTKREKQIFHHIILLR